jgi:hypothetical protein
VPVKVEQINAYLTQTLTRSIKIKRGKKMSPSRSVPEIAVQVVEDVVEKTFTTELFSNV